MPTHLKTRRGRPPKYQWYWISLAKEKAAQQAALQANNVVGSTSGDRKGFGSAEEQLQSPTSPIIVEGVGLKQKLDGWTSRDNLKAVGREQRRPTWPLTQHDLLASRSGQYPAPVQPLLHRDLTVQKKGLESEDAQLSKKFKTENISNGFSRNLSPLFVDVPVFVTISPNSSENHSNTYNYNWMPTCERVNAVDPSTAFSFPPGFQRPATASRCEISDRTGSTCCLGEMGPSVALATSDCALDLSCNRSPTSERRDEVILFETTKTADLLDADPGSIEEHRVAPSFIPIQDDVRKVPEQTDVSVKARGFGRVQQNGASLQERSFSSSVSGWCSCEDAARWNVDQVVEFVSSVPGCCEYAECFRQEDIDGLSLLQLSEHHLLSVIRMKLGPSLHLKKAIDNLISNGPSSH